jgi:Iap family predicted aminopeptidase
VNIVEALAVGVGPRLAGSAEAGRAADAVAEAFRELGLEPRLQEFDLLAYEPEQPWLEVEGEEWPAGPCMYAHAAEVEGRVRRIGESSAPVGKRKLATWAIEDADGRDLGRLTTSPFSRGAIPFASSHVHVTTPPTAFVSAHDAERLEDGMHVRLRVAGEFVRRRERNVIADARGSGESRVLVTAHYDSVFRGPGAIDNASGVEGVRRAGERLLDKDVTLIAFAAEEIKLVGSRFYVDEAKIRGELKNITGVVNLDCIAHGEQLMLLASPDELRGRMVEAARALGLHERYEIEPGPATGGVDSHWFADAKVPAATICHFPYDEYHLPEDTPDLVDENLMRDAVDLAFALVESQLARPVAREGGWGR